MKRFFSLRKLGNEVDIKSYSPIIVLLLMITLSGCNSVKYYDATIREETFAQNNKAIVILKTLYSSNCILPWKDRDQLPVQTDWAKFDPSYDNKETRITYDFGADNGLMGNFLTKVGTLGLSTLVASDKRYYAAYMIDPGTYVLDRIRLTIHKTHYYSIVDGWDKVIKRPNFASFEVQPGEIVYLGDIEISPTRNSFFIRPLDHYNEAVTFFKENYPQITAPVIKRLVKPRNYRYRDLD